MTPKKLLYLLRQPPYQGAHGAETIDAVLVTGIFDQQVSVLFKDDGVLQLLADQQGALLGRRSISSMLGALPEYDINDLYVCAESLIRHRLSAEDLCLPVTILDLDGKMCTSRERGLQTIAVHPNFSENRYIYLYYNLFREGCLADDSQDGPWNVLARFQMDPETLMLDYDQREVLWR